MNILSLIKFIVSHPLNRAQPSKALIRFVRWQIGSRILPYPVALPYAAGTSFVCERGMGGATQNYYCGLHESNEMGFVLHLLSSSDLFIDIGANVGTYTLLAAGAAGANVIAVEPIPKTFDRLQRNIRYNSLNVQAHCVGLSSSAGLLHFTTDLDAMNRVALSDDVGPSISVPVMTLDNLCRDQNPTVIKIDVEGHELSVLKGGAQTLSSPSLKAVIMETNESGARFGHTDDELVDTMFGHGFKTFKYDAMKRELTPANKGDLNTIFLRHADEIEEACKASPRYSLVNGDV